MPKFTKPIYDPHIFHVGCQPPIKFWRVLRGKQGKGKTDDLYLSEIEQKIRQIYDGN
jgi:hypothetical protein